MSLQLLPTPRPAFDLNDVATLKFDLSNLRAKDLQALVQTFEEAMRAHPELGPLPVSTGWVQIDGAKAVNLLLRNFPGANRKIVASTVFSYALMMARGDWKATGQPILIDANGVLRDAQHRLYASLVAGVCFQSYVITGIEPIDNLFAYIDTGRTRPAPVALQTAGLNGQSATIVRVIRLAEEVNNGVFDPTGLTRLPRLFPYEVLELAKQYPNALQAARSAASDWSGVVEYLGRQRKHVVAYFGMRIVDLHGEQVADEFMDQLLDLDNGDSDDPIAAFRKLLNKDKKKDVPMRPQYVLAALIKTFNAWHKHETLGRRWMLQVDEDFPVLEGPPPEQLEAAE